MYDRICRTTEWREEKDRLYKRLLKYLEDSQSNWITKEGQDLLERCEELENRMHGGEYVGRK